MVHSHLLYGLIVWRSTISSNLKKLNSIQNKAVKLIGGRNYLNKATPYYSKLNIIKLLDLQYINLKLLNLFKDLCTLPFLNLFLTFLLRLVKSLVVQQDLWVTVTIFIFLTVTPTDYNEV